MYGLRQNDTLGQGAKDVTSSHVYSLRGLYINSLMFFSLRNPVKCENYAGFGMWGNRISIEKDST